MKKCPICLSEFISNNTRKIYCSSKCVRVNYLNKGGKSKQSKYYKENRSRIAIISKKLERPKNRKLQERYGIDLNEYNQMVKNQDGRCAICKNELKLFVDHCHATGKVRGLLCNGCNRGIGFMNDSVDKLISAANYIKDSLNEN